MHLKTTTAFFAKFCAKKAVVVFIVFLCFVSFPAAQETVFESDRLMAARIMKVKRSVVAVGAFYFNDVPKVRYMGTGFAVSDGKKIVTNHHVIAAVEKEKRLPYLRIFHPSLGNKGIRAKVAAVDEFHDLAILIHEGEPFPVMDLADSDTVKEGYSVGFTGYPIGFVLGLNPTTHTGIISGIAPLVIPSPTARIIDGKLIRHLDEPYDVFQIDATAFPGNSGSPVFLLSTGRVAGVINQVFVKGKKEHAISNPTGITYAIPSVYVDELLQRLKRAKR